MEAARLLSLLLADAALDALDEDGRPLGEQASPVLYRASSVDERPCPYEDGRARARMPMNVAALRQANTCWREVLAQLSRLAALHATSEGPLSGHQVWQAHLAVMCAPLLWWRAHDAPLPRALSALYKLSLGFATALPMLLLSQPGVGDAPLGEALSGEEFFALNDAQGWLIGQMQVCAGPKRLITQSYETICWANLSAPPAHPCFERDELTRLSAAMARAHRDLMHAALLAREGLEGEDALTLCPGLELAPWARNMRAWPLSARLYHSLQPLRPFALVRALPGLKHDHLDRLWPAPQAPLTSAEPHPLRRADALLERAILTLSEALALPAPPDASTIFEARPRA